MFTSAARMYILTDTRRVETYLLGEANGQLHYIWIKTIRIVTMSLARVGLAAVLVLCIHGIDAQFMAGFFENMNNMMANMQGMTRNMAYMNEANYARARAAGANLGPGQRRFFDDGQTRGYAYRSPDGGFSSYSFSSGGPGSSGFMFHTGPDGTYERRW